MKAYSTSSEAMTALQKKGYVHDFNLHPECLVCMPLNIRLKPEEFHVDEVHRFEGMNNPDDSEVLFAITSTSGVKGLLLDAYGAYADSLSAEMIGKLKVDSQTSH
ncbi:hypothetical protein BH10BAC4_BH10BAC4_21010 [soil metagenome]